MTTSSTGNNTLTLVPNPDLDPGVVLYVDTKGVYSYGFDPAASLQFAMSADRYTLNTTGTSTTSLKSLAAPLFNTPYTWSSTTPIAVSWPRGFGKTTMMKNMMKTMKDLAKAAEKTNEEITTGLEKLRAANELYERKIGAARADAKVAVTQEKVYAFASANYLPESYARKLLEEAYVDTVLNEGISHGEE